MSKTTKLILLFLPIFFLLALALFIRIAQYEPLYPDNALVDNTIAFNIPILPTDPVIGNPKAAKTVIVFEDFGCEACKRHQDMLETLQEENPNAFKIIWKGLPVVRVPYETRPAHIYAFCAHNQGQFDAFKQSAFSQYSNLSEETLLSIVNNLDISKNKFDRCLNETAAEQSIQITESIAGAIGIQAVPSFFLNNKQIEPPSSIFEWRQLLLE